MKAITIEGKKVELLEGKNSLYNYFFEVTFEDGETDKIGLQSVKHLNKSWLEDNFDIEGTEENINLFLNLLN